MPVLAQRVSWRLAKPPRAVGSADLSPEEQERARVAIRFLVKRFGTWGKLAAAMKANVQTVRFAVSARGAVSAGVALRAARAAGVPLEDVLSGAWPSATACPHCGRG